MTPTLSTRLRALGLVLIVLVVFIHANNAVIHIQGLQPGRVQAGVTLFVQEVVGGGMAQVAVPLFFAISGYLFFQRFTPTARGYLAKLRQRLRTLVVPYEIRSALGVLLFWVLQLLPWSTPYFTTPGVIVRNFTPLDLLARLTIAPLPYQFWFARTLLVLVLLSPIIYWLCTRLGAVVPCAGSRVPVRPGDTREGRRLSLALGRGGLLLALGSYIALRKPFDLERRVPWSRTLGVSWLLLLVIQAYFAAYHDQRSVMVSNVLVGVGALAVWANYECLRSIFESRLMLWFASFTFFIFASHEPTITIS